MLTKADCLRDLYKRQQNCRYLIGVFTLLLVTHLCYPNSQYLSPQKKYLDLKASESLYHLLKKFQERVGGGGIVTPCLCIFLVRAKPS